MISWLKRISRLTQMSCNNIIIIIVICVNNLLRQSRIFRHDMLHDAYNKPQYLRFVCNFPPITIIIINILIDSSNAHDRNYNM